MHLAECDVSLWQDMEEEEERHKLRHPPRKLAETVSCDFVWARMFVFHSQAVWTHMQDGIAGMWGNIYFGLRAPPSLLNDPE